MQLNLHVAELFYEIFSAFVDQKNYLKYILEEKFHAICDIVVGKVEVLGSSQFFSILYTSSKSSLLAYSVSEKMLKKDVR